LWSLNNASVVKDMLPACQHPTSVASQCLLHCGNRKICTQVQPTVILLAVVEKEYSRRQPNSY